MATPADLQPIYRPRGPDPLRTFFRRRFPDFQAAYDKLYAATFGRFCLPLIVRASCGFERFRPFSCKSYLLCPSCAQKRTLLVGQYLSEALLLTLPHRQAVQWPALGFVLTIPKVLRVFLRHDRELFAEISRLLFDILRRFFCQAAGRSLCCAMVSSHQRFGEFGVWHPHWHISPWMAKPRRGMDAERRGNRVGRRL